MLNSNLRMVRVVGLVVVVFAMVAWHDWSDWRPLSGARLESTRVGDPVPFPNEKCCRHPAKEDCGYACVGGTITCPAGIPTQGKCQGAVVGGADCVAGDVTHHCTSPARTITVSVSKCVTTGAIHTGPPNCPVNLSRCVFNFTPAGALGAPTVSIASCNAGESICTTGQPNPACKD